MRSMESMGIVDQSTFPESIGLIRIPSTNTAVVLLPVGPNPPISTDASRLREPEFSPLTLKPPICDNTCGMVFELEFSISSRVMTLTLAGTSLRFSSKREPVTMTVFEEFCAKTKRGELSKVKAAQI